MSLMEMIRGLAALGIHYTHDERYDFSKEYWNAFQQNYLGDTSGFEGEFIKIAPRLEGRSPMSKWGGQLKNKVFLCGSRNFCQRRSAFC